VQTLFRRYWKWGPIVTGLSIGIPLLVADALWWAVAAFVAGVVLSLLLVVVPVGTDALATRLVRKAYQAHGLAWPPVDQHEVQRKQNERSRLLLAVGKIIDELETNRHILEKSDRYAFFKEEALPTQDWLAAGGVLTEQEINLPAHVSARRAYRLIGDVNRSIDRTTNDSGTVLRVSLDEHLVRETLDAITSALTDLGQIEPRA
jgi:hypothetical protein